MRVLTQRQTDELNARDVGIFLEIASHVNLAKLKPMILSNTATEHRVEDMSVVECKDPDKFEIVLHSSRPGDVIDWEIHPDQVQFVLVEKGELLVTQGRGDARWSVTLAVIRPGTEHKLEATMDVKYMSIYMKVD